MIVIGVDRAVVGTPAPQDSNRRWSARDHYGLVLGLLVASFVLAAFKPSERARTVPLLLYVTALTLALRAARPDQPGSRLLVWTLRIGSVAAGVLLIVVSNNLVRGLVSLWIAAVLALSIVVVLRRVLAHRVVTLQTIFGALSAYLLIGFFYAAVFSAIARLQHAAFFSAGQPANSRTLQYFSFVTMTTVGYGDFTAAGEPARTLAVFDALTGQIFLVTLVARLVSIFGTVRQDK